MFKIVLSLFFYFSTISAFSNEVNNTLLQYIEIMKRTENVINSDQKQNVKIQSLHNLNKELKKLNSDELEDFQKLDILHINSSLELLDLENFKQSDCKSNLSKLMANYSPKDEDRNNLPQAVLQVYKWYENSCKP